MIEDNQDKSFTNLNDSSFIHERLCNKKVNEYLNDAKE